MLEPRIAKDRNLFISLAEQAIDINADICKLVWRWAFPPNTKTKQEKPKRKHYRPEPRTCYYKDNRNQVTCRYTRQETMEFTFSTDPTQFQERTGKYPTRRLPSPRIQMSANPAHFIPMTPPNPSPDILLCSRKPAASDAGLVQPWPIPGQ